MKSTYMKAHMVLVKRALVAKHTTCNDRHRQHVCIPVGDVIQVVIGRIAPRGTYADMVRFKHAFLAAYRGCTLGYPAIRCMPNQLLSMGGMMLSM